MKIKEVCRKTGLTERAVRLYVEKGLVSPAAEERNGREYREYTDEDVKELRLIAELRRLQFSLDEIAALRTPGEIPRVLKEYRSRVEQDAEHGKELLQAVKGLDAGRIRSAEDLAARLNRSLPKEVTLHFDRMEEAEPGEKERDFLAWQQHQQQEEESGRRLVIGLIAVNLVLSLVGFFMDFNFISLAIQIALCVGLYLGVSWVRWLLAASGVLALVVNFFSLGSLLEIGAAPPLWFWVYAVVSMAFLLVQTILLFRSRAVGAFLYRQKNG